MMCCIFFAKRKERRRRCFLDAGKNVDDGATRRSMDASVFLLFPFLLFFLLDAFFRRRPWLLWADGEDDCWVSGK